MVKIMTKKDLMELKRRLKKDSCTFTRMCGCYVDSEKNRMKFDETFLNLEDESYYKFMNIAKKVLSGTVGDSMMETAFSRENDATGDTKQFLLGLRESRLKNDGLLDVFYNMVIDNYDSVGQYLILIFHDAYDVMVKTSDNNKLDASEEVYEYLLCAICPVELSKPGLSVFTDQGTVKPRIRDWIVKDPESGFLYPAFSDRSSDIDSLGFYSKNPKTPHRELLTYGLCCTADRTVSEKSEAFKEIVTNAFPDNPSDVLSSINDALSEYTDGQGNDYSATVTPELVKDLIVSTGADEKTAETVEKAFKEEFTDCLPESSTLINEKDLKALERKEGVAPLKKEIEKLQQELDSVSTEIKTYDVILRVKPQKQDEVSTRIIDGKKCIIIPMDDNECAIVNGIATNI